jgi:alkanesulfonate monooxygenase SsuD/methylene tetrahydromethanopterin reductase-like flavin-dependent oxidoreductase (luciferase family)
VSLFVIGLTDHLEGPREQPSAAVFDEVSDLVRLADRLGVHYAWFSEHHAHAHHGHMPAPLLYALHLAGQTERIRLGTAIICLNLHHPLDIAEQVAVADLLTKGRMSVGLGLICSAWRGTVASAAMGNREPPPFFAVPPHHSLPVPGADLAGRCWLAVNSLAAARIAGTFGFNMLFSHLRTPDQYRQYKAAYRAAGGTRLVAANRPVFVGPDDESAFTLAKPALRTLWRRFRQEGKIPAETPEPAQAQDLCGHPINFIVGGPESVARQLGELYDEVPFDVANVEVRWAGLPHDLVCDSLRRLMEEVMPILRYENDDLGDQ